MTDSFIEQIRKESPTLNKVCFLNHASTAPLHGRVQKAFFDYLKQWENYDFTIAREKSELARETYANLIGASKEEILYTSDVTQGTNLAVHMLKYNKKSNIVCYWNDYAGQVHSALFMKNKKKVEYRPVPDRNGYLVPEDFAEKIDKHTEIVLISHVQWLTGFRSDIKEITKIAHENGAKVLVDVIQSSGVLTINVKDWDADFVTTGVAKWLLGPNQAGFFYIKKELIEEYDPPFPGYQGADYGSLEAPYWDVKKIIYREGIDKFQVTNIGPMMYQTAYEGLKIIMDYGIENIEKRVLELTTYLIKRIQESEKFDLMTPIEEKHRAGIVNIKVDNNIEKAKKIREQGIVISPRFGGIRVSPHFYNTKEDIDKFIDSFLRVNNSL